MFIGEIEEVGIIEPISLPESQPHEPEPDRHEVPVEEPVPA
jgi:hypothetical protein